MEKKIGFIGLGNMGLEMAKNLVSSGYHLQVYNRSPEKAAQLEATAISHCRTAAEAASGVQLLISMLSDDSAVRSVLTGPEGILRTFPKTGIHLSMSTLSPGAAKEFSELHTQAGNTYLSAPVFGRPEAAAARKLWVCVSGDNAAKAQAKEVLDCLGQGVTDFGADVQNASVVKILGNFMIFSSVEMMAEAFRLAEASGLDRAAVASFFGSTVFNAPVYQNYGRLIAERQYEPVRFKAVLGLKDLRLAHDLAEQKQTAMPAVELTYNRLKNAVDNGLGDRDCVEAFDRGVAGDHHKS